MTNASKSTRTITQHRFVVPCEEPWGGDWKDFSVALHWAKQTAKDLGVNTTTDDWSSLHVEDGRLVIVLIEEEDE